MSGMSAPPSSRSSSQIFGRSILITGASSGIGEAVSLACAERGMQVVLAGRDERRLEAVSEKIQAHGGKSTTISGDIRNRVDIDAMVQHSLYTYGRIDVALINAGVGCALGLEHADDADIAAAVEINLLGTMRCLNALLPIMRLQKSGHILVVGSVTSTLPWPNDSIYSTTKAALRHLVRRVRREVKGSGIGLTEVVPGVIDTPLSAGLKNFPKTSAAAVAQDIADCLERPIPTLITPSSYKRLLLAHRVAPGAVASWIARKSAE